MHVARIFWERTGREETRGEEGSRIGGKITVAGQGKEGGGGGEEGRKAGEQKKEGGAIDGTRIHANAGRHTPQLPTGIPLSLCVGHVGRVVGT